MNEFYIFGDDVPDLRNERFGINGEDNRYDSTPEYLDYLSGFSSPETIFDALVFDAGNTDRFSVLFPDLFEALQLFDGTTETNGLRFSAFPVPESSNEVYAIVRLVLNGSNGDLAGIERNMFITSVDGITLTTTNFADLLTQDTATFDFANYNDNGTETLDDDIITPNGTSITASKSTFTDNPVHRVEVIEEDNETIGYIMYNSFRGNFETELNEAFATLSAANVQHLVLDLRYNGGGSILTATRLANMITGQFNGQPYANNINGPNRQNENTTFNFTNTIDGGATTNSLGLDKVYVLTTNGSASASELTINSLRPYIEVVQIGTNTSGKTTSNRLVFDSPDFGTSQVTSAHTYALFPLTGNVSNRDDVLVPSTGLVPNILLEESRTNFGTLGDVEEPLLARAIADITGSGRFTNNISHSGFEELKSKKLDEQFDGYMYFK
ncbi:hypothetical protein BTO05_04130 [Winogradskyella sp. PC-19]|nr:hypothetical protein BTO05_04130 [Winogradskyella sp. PC-19]